MNTSATDMITFERVTGNIGADVHGVDLHDLPPDIGPTLRQALAEHGVLFFRAEPPITDDEFSALGSQFGDVYSYPYGHSRNKGRTVGSIVMEEGAASKQSRTNVWHTDGTSQATPPYAALLTPECVPTAGGDTMWASMTAAYDGLSPYYQRLLDDMEAVHSTANVARYWPPEQREATFGKGDVSTHPVVPTDPLTGRKYLYVNGNYTDHLVGVSSWESEKLLSMLYDHVNTPEYHVRLRWQVGTVAVWHERVTQHRAVADWTDRRVLRRIVLRGDAPTR